MEKKPQYIQEMKVDLLKLDIGELRKKASKVFGIKLQRDNTKDDIVDLIVSALERSNYADEAEGELKKGYARIKLLPVAGKVTFPVYLNCNGYQVFIPVNHEVDVPIKVVEVLEHAEEIKQVANELGEYHDAFELSYPFQVLQVNEGPDPKPGAEVARDRKWEPYKKFFKKMGYWPSKKVLDAYTATTLASQFNQYTVDQAADNE